MKLGRKRALDQALLCCCFFFLVASGQRLRGNVNSKESWTTEQSTSFQGNFSSLSCNDGLPPVEEKCTKMWSSVYGLTTTFNHLVTIPCGECVLFDIIDSTITFNHGLDIQGRLQIFRKQLFLEIQTPFIIVQGDFQVQAKHPIDGRPVIRISLLSLPSSDSMSFQPHQQNSHVCPQGVCTLDRQYGIIVAGGRIDLDGLPDSMSHGNAIISTPIEDLQSSADSVQSKPLPLQFYEAPITGQGCPTDGVYIRFSSDTNHFRIFTATMGSSWKRTQHGLLVYERRHERHGPLLDLRKIRHCLRPHVTYLVTAQVRLSRADGSLAFQRSDCNHNGTGCLEIVLDHETVTYDRRLDRIWKEDAYHELRYDTINTIAVELTFCEHMLLDDNIYLVMALQGPGPGVDIELLEFILQSPPQKAAIFDNACKSMAPPNANAELLSISPFPLQNSHRANHLVVRKDEDDPFNHYFAVTGRWHHEADAMHFPSVERGLGLEPESEVLVTGGLTWHLPHECVASRVGSLYEVSLDARVHATPLQSEPVTVEVWLRGTVHSDSTSATQQLISCPPSLNEWVTCHGMFTLQDSMQLPKDASFDVVVGTAETSHVNFDVDNINISWIQGPRDQLIVSANVEEQWLPGSKVVLDDSFNPHDAEHSTYQIVDSFPSQGSELRTLRLDRAVPWSVLSRKKDAVFATSVTLLSRNIDIISAKKSAIGLNGLLVINSPNQLQRIKGVCFQDTSTPVRVADSSFGANGFIIEGNSFMRSGQGGIYLRHTKGLTISSNVFFDSSEFAVSMESSVDNDLSLNSVIGVVPSKLQHFPSGFFSDSPSNQWTANSVSFVVGGFGYWLDSRGHGDEEGEDIHTFDDNLAHHTTIAGLRVDGLTSLNPTLLRRFKSFKNGESVAELSPSCSSLHLIDWTTDANILPSLNDNVVLRSWLQHSYPDDHALLSSDRIIAGQGDSVPDQKSVFMLE